MSGRVAAVLLAFGLAGPPAAAQPVEPPPIRPDPSSFLLPPVEPIAPTRAPARDLPAARGATDDLPPPPAAKFSLPKDVTPVSAQVVEDVRRAERQPEKPLRGDELFDYLSDAPSVRRTRRPRSDDEERSSSKVGDKLRDALDLDRPRGWFRGDRGFEGMISPVTNPFLFEDPRAVTEIRPIFIYQKIPTPQPNFAGGNVWFVGTQARIAFTERLSLTLNKLGATAVNPAGRSFYDDEFGFSEIWFGPKYTIIRDEEFGTVLAGGVQFQVPVGSAKAFQDTGSLSIVPYVSVAQPFLKSRLGTFNTTASAGYAFSTTRDRSDYLYVSGHLDYDVGNAHRFYPLAELNWFQYTTDGRSRLIAGEGRDLINFGGLAKGSNLLTGALGGRVKLTKSMEVGAAYEFPLVGNRDFFQSRFTVDFIWRY